MNTKRISAGLCAVGVTALLAASATPALADLTPDSTFGGGDGYVTNDSTTTDNGVAVVANDSRILVVEDHGDDTVNVLAYTLTGAVDTTFGGGDGVVDVSLATVADIELMPNGKLLLAGDRIAKTPGRVVRLNANGTPDTNFSGDGFVTLPYEMRGLDVDSRGRVVAGGMLILKQDIGLLKSDFGVARLRGNGKLDTSFSGDGKAKVGVDVTDRMTDVGVDSADRPVVVGSAAGSVYALTTTGVVARFKANGAVDGNFSGNGFATVNLSKGQNTGVAVGFGAKNRVVVAMANQEKFGGVRFLSNGKPDSNYSGDGKVAGNHGGSVYAASVAKGAIVVTGAGGTGFDQMLVGGVTAKGKLDATFGTGGRSSYDVTPKEDFGFAVFRDSAGSVLVSGTAADGADNDLFLTRLVQP